ncbi:MAG: lipid-A-disaccharide synthase [Planctomycetota bacterium]
MPTSDPRAGWRDHLAVAGILGLVLLNLVPILLFLLFGWVLGPGLRAKRRLTLAEPPPAPVDPPAVDPARFAGRRLEIVAGEASGDRLVAPVVAALRRRAPDLLIEAMAGPATRAAGATLRRDLTQDAVMGFTAVLASIGTWWSLLARTFARWRVAPPDVLLTVDFPGLNLRLARFAKTRGVRTIHLVAPQIWAHGPWRVVRCRRALHRLLASFPFEVPLLAGGGIPTWHVGHPLFEAPAPAPRTPAEPPGGEAVVEIWPGSRRQEISGTAPLLGLLARELVARRGPTRFVPRLADPAHREALEAGWRTIDGAPALAPDAGGLPLLGALACSGTATAELAVALVPHAGLYRVGRAKRVLAWLGVTAPFILLPNLVAGRRVVPERLLAGTREAASAADDLLAPLADPARWSATRADLETVRARLVTSDVAERAARAVLAEAAPHLRA